MGAKGTKGTKGDKGDEGGEGDNKLSGQDIIFDILALSSLSLS